ncbi:hypothetical protein [Halodesulfovibrio aestuarii]|uniref:Bacteriophage SP-beta YorD domain-containing protein n=1 Tax=Halodesulfovibrio aestuarii TaxID=126333 RepID=A0ABV4JWX7_9BACT
MNVTVIPADKFIQVDGVGFEPVEFEYDEGVHAIQWDGVNGHIEFVTSDGGIMTTPVSQMEVQPYVDAWQAEKARLDALENAQAEEDETQQRIAEIQDLLVVNDLASVRPLRAKIAGTATPEDDARLAELEEQAQALRAELATFTAQLEIL